MGNVCAAAARARRAIAGVGLTMVMTLAATGLSVVAQPSTAGAVVLSAQTSCGSLQATYDGFGWYATFPATWNETPVGVAARLTVRPGPLCANVSSAFSTSWVALFDNDDVLYDDGDVGGIVQVGYMRRGTFGSQSCMYNFTAFKIRSSDPGLFKVRNDLECLNSGVVVTYTVRRVWNPVFGYIECMESNFNGGMECAWLDVKTQWRYIGPAYSGETTYRGSNMPGTSTSRARSDVLQIQSWDTELFRATPCYLGGDFLPPAGTRYWWQVVQHCVTFDIWTA
jgi:hypothetical protein